MERPLSVPAAIAGSAVFLAFAIGMEAQVVPVQPLVPPPSAETGAAVNETGNLWFIELTNPPGAD